jgi:hypothetical protein
MHDDEVIVALICCLNFFAIVLILMLLNCGWLEGYNEASGAWLACVQMDVLFISIVQLDGIACHADSIDF